jgi:hypothetical protein
MAETRVSDRSLRVLTMMNKIRMRELTTSELEQLDERLKSIEEVTKRGQSIRSMWFTPMSAPGDIMRGLPSSPSGPQAPVQ